MMENKHIRFAGYTALLIAFGANTPGMAAVCNDITFYAHNTQGIDIRIDAVLYRDQNNNNPSAQFTENIPAFTCVQHSSCAGAPQNLGSAIEPKANHNLTDFQYQYAEWDKSKNSWGEKKKSKPHTPTIKVCTDHRHYGDDPANPFNVP
jgi:hypothetical protein